MILEQAVLDVVPGRGEEFRAAFAEAEPILRRQRGYRGHRLLRRVPGEGTGERFLLLVTWERLEDHVEGFRGGPDYPRWRELLHRFYDPFPTVEHYESLPSASGDVPVLAAAAPISPRERPNP